MIFIDLRDREGLMPLVFSARLRWADGWGAGRVVIFGESELIRGVVQLKNLADHTQVEALLAGLADCFRV